jgi:hypothetical protein
MKKALKEIGIAFTAVMSIAGVALLIASIGSI